MQKERLAIGNRHGTPTPVGDFNGADKWGHRLLQRSGRLCPTVVQGSE
ncbi:hypothetical protein [Candidatus Williamhamiltonella defendens]|nr:hypothetical protein [Candidatus Hamiltonella defensa]